MPCRPLERGLPCTVLARDRIQTLPHPLRGGRQLRSGGTPQGRTAATAPAPPSVYCVIRLREQAPYAFMTCIRRAPPPARVRGGTRPPERTALPLCVAESGEGEGSLGHFTPVFSPGVPFPEGPGPAATVVMSYWGTDVVRRDAGSGALPRPASEERLRDLPAAGWR